MVAPTPATTLLEELSRAEPPLLRLEVGGDGRFRAGQDGVQAILAPADRQVEFICYPDKTLCYVTSALGYPALYPLEPVSLQRPLRAVLMDLDGTSIRSEGFWIWAIQQTTASLLGDASFRLEEADLPYVSGRSVSEHLQHCLFKYCPGRSVSQAREVYFQFVHAEMQAILDGKARPDTFQPAPGLKPFLETIRARGIKIGLVTAGLYEKAWPEILSAFQAMELGDPRDLYDSIVTAGFPLRGRQPGTLGELEAKPHPWLYAETARVGLGIEFADRHSVVGVEDSAAGVIAIRLAGFSVIGVAGGNIEQGGVRGLCHRFCQSLDQALQVILGEE